MLSITKSMALHGLEGFLIDVQVDISSGMPSWDIVGLPDVSVKEAKERVRTAIKNSGYELFSRKIVVNLAPANIKKEGSIFDLPIAVGILKGLEAITLPQNEDILMIGELSLNGSLNPINGALPICIEAKKQGIKKIILPKQNEKEASVIDGMEILGANDLAEVVQYLNGNIKIESLSTNWEDCLKLGKEKILDFADVKTIMLNTGMAHMGIGRASGENRAEDAAKQAVQSPLLETSIEGARGVIINITGGTNLGLHEVNTAAELIQRSVDPEANIIFGAVIDESLDEDIVITVIATGFEKEEGPLSGTMAVGDIIDRAWDKKLNSIPTTTDNSNSQENLDIPTFLRRK